MFDPVISETVKHKVHLEILRMTLEYDRKKLDATKMERVYAQLLNNVILKISDDLRLIKRKMQLLNIRIVQEEQQADRRFIIYKHKGYLHERFYPNYRLQIECESILQKYFRL